MEIKRTCAFCDSTDEPIYARADIKVEGFADDAVADLSSASMLDRALNLPSLERLHTVVESEATELHCDTCDTYQPVLARYQGRKSRLVRALALT